MGGWKTGPEGSNGGDFGPDDQIGRLTLLTRERVLKGIAGVREGRSFGLSLPLDLPGGNLLNPARHPPQRFATRAPDGTDRYLVDEAFLMETTRKLGGRLLDPLKTTVVQDQRCMTTWVVRKE